MSQDPIGFDGGLNLFTYVGNNPIGFVDPNGLDYTFQDEWDRYHVMNGKTALDELRRQYRKILKEKGYLECSGITDELVRRLHDPTGSFRAVPIGVVAQDDGSYAHWGTGIVDNKTNEIVTVFDPIPTGLETEKKPRECNIIGWALSKNIWFRLDQYLNGKNPWIVKASKTHWPGRGRK